MKNLARIFTVLVFTLSFSIAVNAETVPNSQTSVTSSDSKTTETATPISTETAPAVQVPETGLFKTDTIEFDGKPVEFSTISYKDRIYVKLRDLCYTLKCNIEVDNNNKIINILKKPSSVQENVYAEKVKTIQPIKINLDLSGFNIKTDGINTYMESIIYQGRTYVPVRFFSEVFDKKVDWIKEKRKVTVSTVPDVIVGSVNGQALHKKDFDYIFNPQYNNFKNNNTTEPTETDLKTLKDTCFDNLVLYTVLMQKAAKGNYTLSESDYGEINDTINSYIQAYGGVENFRSIMEESGVTLYQFSNNLRDSKLINKMALDLVTNVNASEETIKKYYEDNKSMYIQPEQVRAKHILFSTKEITGEDYDAQKKAEIKKKAEEVLAQIKAGADFDELMNKYTEDPGTANYPNGYTFSKGEMVQEFEEKSFSMKVGEISDLVETQFGYHIIKLEEKIPETQLKLDDVKDSIKAELDPQEKQNYFDKLLVQFKAESAIVNTLE